MHREMRYLSTGNAVFKLTYHLVIVTKYRKKILTKEMIRIIKDIVKKILKKQDGKLIEINGEEDHVHILFETKPTIYLPKIINSIKTVSSRILRKKFNINEIKKNGKVGKLWSPSYFIISTGGASIDILKQYIQNQGNKVAPPKQSLGGV